MDELCVYTAKELAQLPNLPGYRYPARLPEIVEHGVDWQPVGSLSIFRHLPGTRKLQTLTGLRHSSTHEGVVSTFTCQIPRGLQPALIAEAQCSQQHYPKVMIGARGPSARNSAESARFRPFPRLFPDNQRVLPFLCADIIARKLGLPELIGMRYGEGHLGTVSLSRVLIGVSGVGEEDNATVWEPLIMYCATLMLDPAYADAIPAETKRYSPLGWTDNALTFPEDLESPNRVMRLAPYLSDDETIMSCAYGQCLRATAAVIAGPDLLGHLGLTA